MSILGGSSQPSHLLDDMNSSGSQTLTMPYDTSRSTGRDSFGGVYVHRARGHSSSPPESGQLTARSISHGSAVHSPDYSTPSADGRSRTYSTPTLRRTSESSNHSEGSLRRRSRLNDSNNSYELPMLSRNTSSPTSSTAYSSLMQSSPCLRRNTSNSASQPKRIGPWLQCMVVLIILGLVWDSHRKVEVATEQLLRYQKEETHLIEKMTNVQNHAEGLRIHIKNIKDQAAAETNSVEPALKTLRLQQELAHLEHEDLLIAEQLEGLKKRIQKSARESIVKMYGEGTLRVDLQLSLPQSQAPGIVTLELSKHTPHAVWVWLQQLIRHDWDDSMFRWKLEHVILATPARLSSQNYKLEFIESNQDLNHERFSIGLTQREDGGINFYINLLDNGPYHEGDVCIGKVVGGFGALNKLLNVPVHKETNHLDPAVSIRKATVSVVPPSKKATVVS